MIHDVPGTTCNQSSAYASGEMSRPTTFCPVSVMVDRADLYPRLSMVKIDQNARLRGMTYKTHPCFFGVGHLTPYAKA